MLGAGGSARAVVVALIDAGATEIRLANRTRAKAEALLEHRIKATLDATALQHACTTLIDAGACGPVGGARPVLDGICARRWHGCSRLRGLTR